MVSENELMKTNKKKNHRPSRQVDSEKGDTERRIF